MIEQNKTRQEHEKDRIYVRTHNLNGVPNSASVYV